MRIGDLSRHSGVPVPTIKYYLREGLLPAGERTSPNQVAYADGHLHRLRLVRALVEVGRLPVAAAREVLALVDDPGRRRFEALGKVQYALTAAAVPAVADRTPAPAAVAAVDDLLRRRGWTVRPGNPARHTLAALLTVLGELGHDDLAGRLDAYAGPAGELAATDVGLLRGRDDLDDLLEGLVVTAAVGDAVVAALRRLAQEHVAAADPP